MPVTQLTQQQSYQICRRITARHARSFYFSSFVLELSKRKAAYAVYAFCRHCDDRVDEGGLDESDPETARTALLADFHLALEARGFPWAPAFAQTVKRYGIPRRYLEELIHGVCLDAETVRIVDWEELRCYCYYVAGVVGLIMARIFGLRDLAAEKQAVELGWAMQLTNICRDVGEDIERGRIYLPAQEMARHGVHESDLLHGRAHNGFQRLLAEVIERSDALYASAEQGIPLIDDRSARACARVMSRVYGGINREIEALHYNVFSDRARTDLPRKLVLAVQGMTAR